MFSLFRSVLIAALALPPVCHAQRVLRVCADPDNLPFSNQARTGFDNRIAELLIRDLGRQPEFVWARARRGFLRERFNHGDCDLLMGTPDGLKRVRQTRPYYQSSYVFVTRTADHWQLSSFSDPSIGSQRIGLQILDEDFSPPSLPLIHYGHASQLVGYRSFGSEAGEIVHAVASRKVGFAVVWGPVAGYYASREHVPLSLHAVSPAIEDGIPFRYDIAIAVHSSDLQLADALNRAIEKNLSEIRHILNSYHVPQLEEKEGGL
ncbi:quinoprotein dehydrogenase-associated putative ABC transporter substrate-binding protein [Terriglobus albidus]|uniref:quinoprotein dehydrogenase-associated putative ABC transporter substrate-binding protein n=1 Tax=Terriglobus albidus TaxID=1592106 RepID=UPI0021DFD1E1|nr:quinoprotein dehydrogenase-associated putative ABC transporter substrate-binding protein [Terriglobus albidus]